MIDSFRLKAEWIVGQMKDADYDDVYDALLGNITKPRSFVEDVKSLEEEYDAIMGKTGLR